jgi:hypothetical protein
MTYYRPTGRVFASSKGETIISSICRGIVARGKVAGREVNESSAYCRGWECEGVRHALVM